MSESAMLLALYNNIVQAAFDYHKHLRTAHSCVEVLPEPKFSNCSECGVLYTKYKLEKTIYLVAVEEFMTVTTPTPPKSGDV